VLGRQDRGRRAGRAACHLVMSRKEKLHVTSSEILERPASSTPRLSRSSCRRRSGQPPAQPQAAGPKPVILIVKLPADAQLEVEGAPTKATGAVRTFKSLPLDVRKKYQYTPQGHVDEERQAGHRHQGGRCPRRARQRS